MQHDATPPDGTTDTQHEQLAETNAAEPPLEVLSDEALENVAGGNDLGGFGQIVCCWGNTVDGSGLPSY